MKDIPSVFVSRDAAADTDEDPGKYLHFGVTY